MKRRNKSTAYRECFLDLFIFRKKSKLRIIFDAKGMRQSSVFEYLKIAFNSLNKYNNKLVAVKEGLYNSFENGIEKL